MTNAATITQDQQDDVRGYAVLVFFLVVVLAAEVTALTIGFSGPTVGGGGGTPAPLERGNKV